MKSIFSMHNQIKVFHYMISTEQKSLLYIPIFLNEELGNLLKSLNFSFKFILNILLFPYFNVNFQCMSVHSVLDLLPAQLPLSYCRGSRAPAPATTSPVGPKTLLTLSM